jgi:hypothetical protein
MAFVDVMSSDSSAPQFREAALFCDELMNEIRAISKSQTTRKLNKEQTPEPVSMQ